MEAFATLQVGPLELLECTTGASFFASLQVTPVITTEGNFVEEEVNIWAVTGYALGDYPDFADTGALTLNDPHLYSRSYHLWPETDYVNQSFSPGSTRTLSYTMAVGEANTVPTDGHTLSFAYNQGNSGPAVLDVNGEISYSGNDAQITLVPSESQLFNYAQDLAGLARIICGGVTFYNVTEAEEINCEAFLNSN